MKAYKNFDNKSNIIMDDLIKHVKAGDRVYVYAPLFSIYGYQLLKKQLDGLEKFSFLYSEPTFIKQEIDKELREFYIPREKREQSISGTDLEIKLRNELTQKSIATECSDWIHDIAQFKSTEEPQGLSPFLLVCSGDDKYIYFPFKGITAEAIGAESSEDQIIQIDRMVDPVASVYLSNFLTLWNDEKLSSDVTDQVLDSLTSLYKENAPEVVYYAALRDIFQEFMEDLDEDVLPKEAVGFKNSEIWNMLYDFQRDAAISIISKLEKYNGCILADSVGLGKTFTALSVIKYYEARNMRVVVLCPKKLSNNWLTFKQNVKNNPIASDALRYDVLYHTDLSRESGLSVEGIDLKGLNWNNYDLVVIDESHNFRNGSRSASQRDDRENRYTRLMNKVIATGVKTKVLMLSATPVNNRFLDLQNQLELAYAGSDISWKDALGLQNDVKTTFRIAQSKYSDWEQLPADRRTTDCLMKSMQPDFFKILDQVTVARSRKQIQRYYDIEAIGPFPKRLKPINYYPDLSTIKNSNTFNDIVSMLEDISLASYTPSTYVFPSRREKYNLDLNSISRSGRELGTKHLMMSALLKRLESSIYSFDLTLNRVLDSIEDKIEAIDEYEKHGIGKATSSDKSIICDDLEDVVYGVESKDEVIDFADMDWSSWRNDMADDSAAIQLIIEKISHIDTDHDAKLIQLKQTLKNKIEEPINPNNKKVLIFTAYADTADYLFENISHFGKTELGLDSAEITGGKPGVSTIKNLSASTQDVLCCFSPESKDRDLLMPNDTDKNIDILIATDCISEGQNLQDCDCVINYDIHWNPVRIVQRFGRVDRIGSTNEQIQLVNFWPNLALDEYLQLEDRVRNRMKISVLSSTGDENVIEPQDTTDAEYRRNQIQQMQNDVVDLEDVSGGVSITDLGLDEFRTDLIAYSKAHPNSKYVPHGIHAVVKGDKPGMIFVLRNRNNGLNLSERNRLHPFYLVYISADGEIINTQIDSRKTLQQMRVLCQGKSKPDMQLCKIFNKQTKQGFDMSRPSELLQIAVDSMIEADEESIAESFFSSGLTSIGESYANSLDDFELLQFLVVC